MADHPRPPVTDRDLIEAQKELERQLRIMFNHHEVVAQQIAELAHEMATLRRDVPSMVAQGIVAAVGDPKTWEAARSGMRLSAERAAGGWLLGSLKWLIDKALWAGLLLVALYSTGGLSMVLKFIASLRPAP